MQEIVAEMKADRDAHIQVKTCVKQKSDWNRKNDRSVVTLLQAYFIAIAKDRWKIFFVVKMLPLSNESGTPQKKLIPISRTAL
jgi:hypothetical protein